MEGTVSQVTVESASDDSYRYTFDKSIEKADFSWLTNNRNISSYDTDNKVLTVHKSGSMEMSSLHNNFILPGLKKVFGDKLKVIDRVYANR